MTMVNHCLSCLISPQMDNISIARKSTCLYYSSASSTMARREDPTAVVGTRLRRVFVERGIDFFDAQKGSRTLPAPQTQESSAPNESANEPEPSESSHTMTPEELYKMRMSLLPQL